MIKHSVLLVVDMQVDFCPGGSLAVPGGDAIIPVINRYIEIFRAHGVPVIVTRDWHPPVTSHFREFGGLWPSHCVQESAGAQFHPALKLPEDVIIVSKGMDPSRDDYSSFRAILKTGGFLQDLLKEKGMTKLFICGLATDYCVRETSLDALHAGLAVTVLKDAVRGVDLEAGDSARALEEITTAGAVLADLAGIEKEFRT